ncbi:MAG: dephospho-CoA kinase [Clostridia bacterium]|nr:dephospho-CoA kinase [Clostridia bacterium]
MRIIGLTGGIACGKSNVSETLRELGAVIVDGDLLSRELTAPGGPALPAIREAFGDGVFHPDGTLNRRALGAAIFGDDKKRALLDGIMQPMLRMLIHQRIDAARTGGAKLCVLDMPLLYEAGLDALCDRVWCVYIPRKTQLERLMARDGFTPEEAEARLRSQLPADEKAARAQVVIDTSGSIGYTKAMIPPLFAQEIRLDHSEGGFHGEPQSAHSAQETL